MKKPAQIVTVTKGGRLLTPTRTPIGPGRRLEHRINKAYQMDFGVRLENIERKIDEIFFLVHPDCPKRLIPKFPKPNPPKPLEDKAIPATAATANEPTPATATDEPTPATATATPAGPSHQPRNESAAKQLDYVDVDFEVIIIQHCLYYGFK